MQPCQVDGTIGLIAFAIASHFSFQLTAPKNTFFTSDASLKQTILLIKKLNLGPSSIQKCTHPVQLELLFNIFIPA